MSENMARTCDSDDRETPLTAIQDLASVVSVLFADRDMKRICVYDPYFCKGGIISALTQCGFNEQFIFNEDKDCYAVQKKGEVPENDIIITNPPYSGKLIPDTVCDIVESFMPGALTYFICIAGVVVDTWILCTILTRRSYPASTAFCR